MWINNKEYLEVPHSNDAVSFKVEEMKMDTATKGLQDEMNISSKMYFIKYVSSMVTYFFERELIHVAQTSSEPYRVPIFIYWRMLSLLSNVSETVAIKAIKIIHGLVDKGAAITSMQFTPVRVNNGEIINPDYGSAIELGFSFGTSSPVVYILIHKDNIVLLDNTRSEITEESFYIILSTNTRSGTLYDESLIVATKKSYEYPSAGKMNAQALLSKLNISGTSGMYKSDTLSIAPIDLNVLKVKSSRMLENLKTLFENKVTIKMHTVGFRTKKNVTYYEPIHTAVIDIHSRISGELLDTIYIIDNYVFFETSFNTSRYDNILKDETVEGIPVYVGNTMYDQYSDSFYYTIFDKDLSNLYIQKYGSVQFRLTWMFANM